MTMTAEGASLPGWASHSHQGRLLTIKVLCILPAKLQGLLMVILRFTIIFYMMHFFCEMCFFSPPPPPPL